MITHKIMFFDIETVSQYPYHSLLPDRWKKLWARKALGIIKQNPEETADTAYNQAGLYPEFGKIICITAGVMDKQPSGKYKIIKKTYAGDDEKKLLTDLAEMMSEPRVAEYQLCGHNVLEFDFPYIRRRMRVHGIKIPALLNIRGKKPWEVSHILDTMSLWREGDYRSYTSLDLLAATFDIESPKDDIDGSEVGHVYWEEQDIARIVTYCEKDVDTAVKVYCAMELAGIEFEDEEEEAEISEETEAIEEEALEDYYA